MAEEKMSTSEKADMLLEVTKLVTSRLASMIDEIHSYYKTYPELTDILTLIIDVSIFDENVMRVLSGNSEGLEKEFQELKTQVSQIEEKIK